MPALQAAGGLVILLMGLEMLHGAPTKVQHDDEAPQTATDRVLVRLRCRSWRARGAITTVLTLSSRVATWTDVIMLLIAVVLLGATIALILLS